ncbi:HIRAN domain-containing protein [Sphingomonas sp. Leaf343]|uniref:HIRAN domain-containing protein n=1 Tax=Sphingomonas sp. Leaf343 TaxID=1736345 RepID=UPI0006FB162C|nr:HIRAN domain-containing protein [Sphingomonas sp. Leaf343]KQR83472.1 hypothetical protein ASG07_07020 [Sphingomonas sp. Leaf343]
MFFSPFGRLTSPREMSLAVVGLDHANRDRSNRRFEMALCTHGEPIRLVREPKNKADENAIAVVSARGIQLGYITSLRAALIARWLDAGEAYDAVFQDAGHSAAIIRARFGGGSLWLPPERDDVIWDRSEEGGDSFDWGC